MKSMIEQCYRMLNRAAGALQSPFLLVVRLYWGWQFAQTGWGKINNIPKVTGFFTSLGIPFPGLNAHFIAGLEFLGGILLILGLTSRLIALPLAIDMIVAYITADREALFSVISDPDKFSAAAPFTFLVASLIVLIFGPGKFSLDAWLSARKGSGIAAELMGASTTALTLAVLTGLLFQISGFAQSVPPKEKIDVSKLGPQVGERVPDFSLKDQNGKTWTSQSIMGPKGAMLVFVRSADW